MDSEGSVGNLQVLLTTMSYYHLRFFVKVSQRYFPCQLSLLILVLHLSTSQQKCEKAGNFCLLWSYKGMLTGKKLLQIRLRDFMIIQVSESSTPSSFHFSEPKIPFHCHLSRGRIFFAVVVGMGRRKASRARQALL